MDAAKILAKQLRNIGPKLAQKMADAGIDTPAKLRHMGAKKAFAAMYPSGDVYGDFNAAYLYALEGAIRDCSMSDLPETTKQEFRDYTHKMQRNRFS